MHMSEHFNPITYFFHRLMVVSGKKKSGPSPSFVPVFSISTIAKSSSSECMMLLSSHILKRLLHISKLSLAARATPVRPVRSFPHMHRNIASNALSKKTPVDRYQQSKGAIWLRANDGESVVKNDVDDFYCKRMAQSRLTIGHLDEWSYWGMLHIVPRYEREFRPFMDQVQKGVGEDDSKWDWVPSTQISVFLQKFLMGLASLFEINIADYMISETVKDWSSLITRSYVEELRLMPSWHWR
ncbi:hypothetical protein PENDEC_c023G05722 [Penicillium decumbens]|uniref:Uncharacterized protein n=1 Tax=Penicillium decumbens TaxID=69771 RepID=A0A1V6P0M1_PENDC|nr:hypothetical protein PENDEC_c023G05722 [Penicillium decumbens]